MKNWQFCTLMATIWIAPAGENGINIVAAAVFLALSAVMLVKEHP
jgi:hypothetical protein